MKSLSICSMKYFTDRMNSIDSCLKIADNLLKNRIYLYGDIYFEPTEKNIFDTTFITSPRINHEYLLAMDYLSALLSAYRQTNNHLYYKKFLDIINQFFNYYKRNAYFPSKEEDMIVHAQTLMFIKSFTIVTYKKSLKAEITALLYEYAMYCYDDRNHYNDHNHGLFTDLSLLHLSVLFEGLPESAKWKLHAVERIKRLFDVAFYEDGFNNEGSLLYFWHNIKEYQEILKFCEIYHISGLEMLRHKLEYAEEVFYSFAHSDGSYPIIGDGNEMVFKGSNNISAIYPHAGICVVKIEEMYLTFKCRGTFQAHTHVDDASITARIQTVDLALDPGQYNYDRYHPINRYLRTSGGHSGIFPLFVDGLGLKEYLDRRNASEIDKFDFDEKTCLISGGYEMDKGAIKVCRNIVIKPKCIEVRDNWRCVTPQTMRQRFVLPKEFLDISKFTASKKRFETSVGKYDISYEITSEKTPIITTMNFGVLSNQYEKFEQTILLDTIAENSTEGEITTVITICDRTK